MLKGVVNRNPQMKVTRNARRNSSIGGLTDIEEV